MKTMLKQSLLAFALLFAAHAQAEPDEGGVGCLPGEAAEPVVPITSPDSLIKRQWLRDILGQTGGNCNSVQVQAALPDDGNGVNFTFSPRDHTYQWVPAANLPMRTLYIRANSMATFQSSADLRMEIYRQSLERPGTHEIVDTMELRVLLVRDPSGGIDPLTGHFAISVWVVVQDIHGQLGFMSTPINGTFVNECDRDEHQFAACLEIVTDATQPKLTLHGAQGQQIMNLPRAKPTNILLGNVATKAGQSSDRFTLAHGAGGQTLR